MCTHTCYCSNKLLCVSPSIAKKDDGDKDQDAAQNFDDVSFLVLMSVNGAK